MRQIFTLLSMGMLCLASKSSFAQTYFEDFEDSLNATNNGCIATTDILQTFKNAPGKNFVIYGNASAYAEPTVSATNVRVFATPYLDLPTNVTISFAYQITAKLSNSTRFINVGWIDSLGTFTSLDSFALNTTDLSIIPKTVNHTFAYPRTARIAIRLGGSTGGGSSSTVFDNVSVNGTMHYGTNCNQAPVAYSNNYIPTLIAAFTADFVKDASNTGLFDTDPENEGLYPVIAKQPSASMGSVVLNADGTFTFTPATGFTGGLVTFQYLIKDGGYRQATSDTATVTLSFPEAAVLPIHLLGFQGSVSKDKGQISWSVADNETGSYFEVQRSADGKKFENIGLQFTSNKMGTESYTYADPTSIQNSAFYRLKVVNKDYTTSFSKIIRLQTANVTADNKITLLQNPVQSSLTFSYTSATAETNDINIYNMAGVKVYSQKVVTQKGSNSMSLNLDSKLTAGSYVVEVAGASTRRTTKFVKF